MANDAPTAAVIIIGDEVLSGRVQDANAFFLATELREMGVRLLRISVVPDDIEAIGAEAAAFSRDFTYVFTSGGVGPTHDDVTMEGIASGFGAPLAQHPALVERFRRRYGDRINEAILKMAMLPEGAEVIDLGGDRFPLIVFRNIYIFPGIPCLLQEKFRLIRERFRTASFHGARVFLSAEEPEITDILNRVVAAHPGVSFGSYPSVGKEPHRVLVTVEAKDGDAVKRAVDELLRLLPPGMVMRVE